MKTLRIGGLTKLVLEIEASPNDENVINLEVYCDEINRVRDEDDRSVWMYLGALFVPISNKKELIDKLLNLRCIKYGSWYWNEEECPNKCGYHNWNNTEIHFRDIHKNKSKYNIAKRWLKFLIEENNRKDLGLVYFYILGIELSKLNLERFGENKGRDLNIYNRFFRTLILGGAKYFFGEYRTIVIENIYHDKGSQEEHEYFPWYTPYKINVSDDKVRVINNVITFVDSDHKKYPDDNVDFRYESQLIQFIDLILGSIHCCLHASTIRKEKIEVASIIKPLLKRLMNNPKNKNSKYHYYRKQQIQFFPKTDSYRSAKQKHIQTDIDGYISTELKNKNNFYTCRPIKLRDQNNRSLFKYGIESVHINRENKSGD